jgi:hypothetical protein
MQLRKVVLIVLAAILSVAQFRAFAQATDLTTDEIASFVKGKRLAALRGTADLRLRFGADGALSIQDGHAVDTGKWRVEGGMLCMQVQKWAFDGCGRMVRTDSGVKLLDPSGAREHLSFNG